MSKLVRDFILVGTQIGKWLLTEEFLFLEFKLLVDSKFADAKRIERDGEATTKMKKKYAKKRREFR